MGAVSKPTNCSKWQVSLHSPTKHPILRFPHPYRDLPHPNTNPTQFHLKSNRVGSPCRLGTAGSQGLKPGALVAPSPSPAPLVSTRRLAWSEGSQPCSRGEGEKWACFSSGQSTSSRSLRGGASTRPARGCRLPAAKYKCARARRLAPKACTAAALSLPRAATEGPVASPFPRPTPDPAPLRQPAPPGHCAPGDRAPQTPVL